MEDFAAHYAQPDYASAAPQDLAWFDHLAEPTPQASASFQTLHSLYEGTPILYAPPEWAQ